MKKSLFLFVLALTALASQAWSQEWTTCTDENYSGYCKYSLTGNCETISTGPAPNGKATCEEAYENCTKNGYHYTDAQCDTWAEIGNDPSFDIKYCKWLNPNSCGSLKSEDEIDNCKNTNHSVYNDDACTEWSGIGKNPNIQALGCCKWSTGSVCYTIWPGPDPDDNNKEGTVKVTECKTGSNTFWNGECPTNGGACPNTTPVYPSSSSTTNNSSSSGANNSSSSSGGGNGDSSSSGEGSQGGWYCVYSGDRFCTSGHAENYTCPNNGVISSTCPAGFDGGNSPIILSNQAYKNMLGAMQNAVNLQVTSSAAIQIFDLKGNAVRSFKFTQGNYVVPLSDLPHGLYIVKASNASWKQTIKVTVR